MSRSKEGREQVGREGGERSLTGSYADQERGRMPYRSERESRQEFPRLSRSARGRQGGQEAEQNRDFSEDDYTEPGRYRYREPRYETYPQYGGQSSRSRGEEFRSPYDREQDTARRAGRYDRRDREGYADEYRREQDAARRVGPYDRTEREGYPDEYGRDIHHWYPTERVRRDEGREGRDERRAERYSSSYGFRDERTRMERESAYGRGLARYISRDYSRQLRCRDLMTRDVTTCSSQDVIRDVADKMDDEGVGSIPVLQDGRLVGIVTDRDIVCRVLAMDLDTRSTPASQACSEDLITCSPDEPVIEALRKMGEFQIRRMPVVDPAGKLQGIVSLADIALEAEYDHALAIGFQEISRSLPHKSRRRTADRW